MELSNYNMFVDLIIPLFDGKTFDEYVIILMVCSLANAIFKKIQARLVLQKPRIQKQEEIHEFKRKNIKKERWQN